MFESTEISITDEHIDKLFERRKVCYLSEMMNFPGVVCRDPDVLEKLPSQKNMANPLTDTLQDLPAKNYGFTRKPVYQPITNALR